MRQHLHRCCYLPAGKSITVIQPGYGGRQASCGDLNAVPQFPGNNHINYFVLFIGKNGHVSRPFHRHQEVVADRRALVYCSRMVSVVWKLFSSSALQLEILVSCNPVQIFAPVSSNA